jgi:hypothetical protein
MGVMIVALGEGLAFVWMAEEALGRTLRGRGWVLRLLVREGSVLEM